VAIVDRCSGMSFHSIPYWCFSGSDNYPKTTKKNGKQIIKNDRQLVSTDIQWDALLPVFTVRFTFLSVE